MNFLFSNSISLTSHDMLLLLYFLMSRFGSYFLLSAHFKIVILAIHSVDANTTLQFHVIFFRFLLFIFPFFFLLFSSSSTSIRCPQTSSSHYNVSPFESFSLNEWIEDLVHWYSIFICL